MFRRVTKLLVLLLLAAALLVVRSDELRLNPAQQVAFAHTYDLVGWEVRNLLSKWVHRAASMLPWNSSSAEQKRSRVREYFALSEELAVLDSRLNRSVAQGDRVSKGDVQRLHGRLAAVKSTRGALRNDVEEVLEATISAVLVAEGLATWGEFIFPAVDIRLTEPPKILVTSPRDRISRTHDVLLDPKVSLGHREEVEQALLERWDLSALVVDIGGVATIPASIVDSLGLRETLELAAHEWLHHYLFFRPLGFNIYTDADMFTLNETFADIAGREIGRMAFELLDEEARPPPDRAPVPLEAATIAVDGDFDFAPAMRVTRQRVDELLEAGSAEEAEAYMEERRRLFVENGFDIRKLNQAFFAFNGTYAESPTSVSPIAGQLHEYRSLMPDMKAFVTTMSRFSRYGQFLDALDRLKPEVGAQAPVQIYGGARMWYHDLRLRGPDVAKAAMYRQDEPEVNLGKILERVRSALGGFRIGGGGGVVYFILGLIVVAALVWLGTGIYTVSPGEQAALRTFGNYNESAASETLLGGTGPGLHWFWPAPIGTRNVVKVDEIRRLELGVRGATSVLAESLMITGDENIVDVQLVVQYDIIDIGKFLFRVVDPLGVTIRDAAETSLRQVVGGRDIDAVLTTEKEAVQAATQDFLQRLLDNYQSGLRIREVKLQNVNPPEQVKDAFDDVVRAREDKERIKNLAEAYEEGILPVARGDAQRLVEEAEGFKAQRVNLATGQANRFLSILAEYNKAKDITRIRLYLEAMEEVLPGITKYIIDADSGGNLLQLLPLATTTSPFAP